MPMLAWIIPLEGGQIDNSLPGGRPGHPANRPPGSWGGPVDPGYGQGGGPVDPGYGRPDWVQGHPGNRPPGSWGGERPGNELPTEPPPGGTPVEDYTPLPPPEDIYSQYVVSVWNPKTASWTTKSYPPR